MTKLIKMLDENLLYLDHKIERNTIYIYVESITDEAVYPYCKSKSNKIHSRYFREFQDLPIGSNKTIIILKNRKFFCLNKDCNKTTFAEQFDFINNKSKKSKRLENKIIAIAKNMSSIAASKVLTENIANVGKTMGYNGSDSSVRRFISLLRKDILGNRELKIVDYIERKQILNLGSVRQFRY